MNSAFKRIILGAGAMVFFLAVSLVGTSLYLNSAAFHRRLVNAIDQAIAGNIRIKGHALHLLSGRLVLSGVGLSGTDGQAIADIGQVSLRLFWPALLWHSLDVSALSIDQPRLDLIAGAGDRMNLTEALALSTRHPKSGGSWIRQITIGDLRLHDGQVVYRYPHKGWSGRITRLEVSGSGNLKRRIGHLALQAGELNLQAPGLDQSLQDVAVNIGYRDGAARPATVTIRAGDLNLMLKGGLQRINGEMKLALTADLGLSLARVRPWLPRPADLAGRLTGRLDLTGALKDPSATLRLHLAGGRVEGVPIQTAGLNVRLERRQVALDALDVRSTWGELDLSGTMDLRPVFPDSFETRAAGWDALRYALDISGRHLTPGRIARIDFPWGGTWQGQAHAGGSGLSAAAAEGTGTISLKAEGVRLTRTGRPAPAGLSAQIKWGGQAVHIMQARADLDRNELDGNGLFHWDTGRFEADAAMQSPRLSALGDILGAKLPGGKATLKLQGRGSVDRPLIHAVLRSRDVSMAAWTFGQLLVEADLGADGVVNFPRLVLVNKGGTLQGRGRLRLLRPTGALRNDPGLDMRLDLDALRLADFSTGRLDGDLILNGHLDVGGSLRHPVADLQLSSSPVRWNKTVARLEGRVRWQEGRLTVGHLNLAAGRSLATLQGDCRWRDPAADRWTSNPLIHADLKADPILLQDWFPQAKGTLEFRAAVQGRIQGLKGTFDVRGSDLWAGGQKFSSVRLEGRLDDETIYADRLVARIAPGQTVQGKGWCDLDRRFRFRLSGDDIALRQIGALQQAHAIQGRLTFSIDARGTAAQPVVTGRLVVRHPRIGDRPWHDFNARIDVKDRQLTLNADMNFNLAARYRLDDGDFDVSAVFDHTDLQPYLAMLAGGQWAGRLSGKIQAAGNRHDPKNIEAQILLTQADLAYQKIELLHLNRLEAGLAHGRVTMPASRMMLMKDGQLTVEASGDMRRDLAVRAQGDVPLAALAPFMEHIGEATGHIRLAAQGQGAWNRMQWRGQAALEKVGFISQDWDQSVHDVSGTVRISPEQIVIDRLSGMLDDGQFHLDGQLQLADGRPVQGRLSLNAQALPVHWPDTMDLSLGTDLVLKRNSGQASLEGRVTLLEGAYYRNVNFNLMSRITQARRAEPLPATWSPPKWLPPMTLNVTVGSRYPLLVDNNVAQLQITPDFKIGGTLAKPLITGRAQVTEGSLMFRGRTFTVTRGVVDFVNPYKIEPTLDVAAEAQIRQWKVTLNITGPPDNLVVKMSSDPAESDSNILSLVLLGRTNTELSQGSVGATPEQMLATLVDSAWGEKIKKKTGVDILQVETGAQDSTQSPDRIQVTVGKYLSPRLTVKYSVEATGRETIQRATSEYRLLENLLASGFQDTAGTYGGELQFRIEFR
jgi:translocation and assembly module TamB